VKTAVKTLLTFTFTFAAALSLGMSAGCEGRQSESSDPDDDKKGASNLCKEYESCDECIAGQQKKKGIDEGRAQTECGAAVVGCWTTWQKPITCAGKEMKNPPE
jgi:hypothetical protein